MYLHIHFYRGGCKRVCVRISSAVFVTCVHISPLVLRSSYHESEAFHFRLLSGSRVATPPPSSPHPPPHPRRVSAPAGAPEIRLSYEKRPPRSCEVDQGSAGANTAKCPGMAQIRQVGSEARWEVGNVCASVFGGQGVGSLVAFHTNVGHLWQTRWT